MMYPHFKSGYPPQTKAEELEKTQSRERQTITGTEGFLYEKD